MKKTKTTSYTTSAECWTKLLARLKAEAEPPPRYLVSEWAERFRYLSRDYSSQPGRYSLDIVPYAREPMDAAKDPTVREVVLMWASQTTKTTILENVLGYFIHADPSPVLMVQPTVEMAQAWSKERFNATIRDTPVLRDLVADAKSRDSGNTIQFKTFPGGNLAIVGANAPSGLAARPRRIVLLDEIDRYPASAGTEGDPVALAIRRTETFWNAVIYLTSTPTVKGLSRIERAYEGNEQEKIPATDMRKWFVPCHSCGATQTLKWSQVLWEKDKPETAWYECEKCKAKWDDTARVNAVRRGEWRPTAQFAGRRGYFLSGLYSPFNPKRGFSNRLHQMAAEFLEAKHGGPETLRTWTNTFLAETYQEEGLKLDASELMVRTEEYTPETLPAGVLMVVGGADVQKDRIELEWIGVGADDETWGIEVVKTYGLTEKPETWQRFGNALNRTFKRADGAQFDPVVVAVDFHYKSTVVKEWSRRAGVKARIMPVIGIGAEQPTLTVRRQHQDGYFHWTISTNKAKDIIFDRMSIDEPGPRYCHFPRGYGYDEEWFRQLTCERAVTKHHKGFPKRVYEKMAGARNEALDMRVYALAAVNVLQPVWEQLAAGLKPGNKQPTAGKQPTPSGRPRPGPPRPMPRGGFVTGWR